MPTEAPIIKINRSRKTAVVRILGDDFQLPLKEWLVDSIMLGDNAIIKDGEIIDYNINTPINNAIDKSYQEAYVETLITGDVK